MPKITRPNQVVKTNTSDRPFSWSDFAKDCVKGEYVLVVGSEAILNRKENPEAEGDSSKLLFNITLDYLREVKHINIIDSQINNFTHLGYHLYSEKMNGNLTDVVRNTLKDCNFRESFDEEIEPSLLALLKTRCFRVVLTTTVDPYIEIAMEKVWGKDGFQVLNIKDGLHKDFETNSIKVNEFREIKPTLYYVFGKADHESNNDFVLTENAAMDTITRWFSEERPKELLRYIQTNTKGNGKDGNNIDDGLCMKIISIGCKFDDWLFRFFWYVLRGNIENLSNGQVVIELNNDDKLSGYLSKQKIRLFDNSRGFMEHAVKAINEVENVGDLPRCTGGIFISYAHEDRYIAQRLFNILKRHFNVWLDEKQLHEGKTEYENRIDNAIRQCKIFMPVLSSQVKKDLEDGKDERFYQKEWQIAQCKYDNEHELDDGITQMMQVLPFVTESYDIRESYHQKTAQCIRSATAFDMKSPKNTINVIQSFINRINTMLK